MSSKSNVPSQRRIKSSHMNKRGKMLACEVNEGISQQNNEDFVCLSPMLPSAQDKSLLKSAGGTYRGKTS